MNTLVALGTGAAFLLSLAATVAPGAFERRGLPPDVYYEAVILILALTWSARPSKPAPSVKPARRSAG